MKKENRTEKKRETWYPFRNLENYKSTQMKVAESKGRVEQLKTATTLTAACRICYGR